MSIDNELFSKEYEVLKLANLDLNDDRYINNELYDKYKKLTESYEKLLKLTGKSINISDLQGRELRRKECETRNLLDNSNQGFLTFGRDLIVDREYSCECAKLFGKKISNINILELLKSDNDDQNELFRSIINDIFNQKDENIKLSYLRKLPNMLRINDKYVNINYKLINYEEINNDTEAIMLILTDITEKKRAEDEILYLSYHDKLTNLFNRAYVDSVSPQLQMEYNMPLSIIVADMNGLKLTNDVFGHQNGDKLIVNASKVLMKCLERQCTVARWGGDEFILILPKTDAVECKKIQNKIKSMCKTIGNDPIELSISLGSATIENPGASIEELFNIAESIMYSNKLIEGKEIKKHIILSIEETLYKRYPESYGHNHRVRAMAVNFGRLLKLDEASKEMENLLLLAYLHDIGKVSIPKEILGKKIPLTENEIKIVRSCTEVGFRMAQSIEEPMLAAAILSLRERWDGKGYPCGLKNENIPLISRIVSIIDSYDVMTHNRPYKRAISHMEALEEIRNCSGNQYDPHLVDKFINNFDIINDAVNL